MTRPLSRTLLAARIACALSAAAALVPAACVSPPPMEPPPLAAMEEPLELREVDLNEDARAALPLGTFSGIVAAEAAQTLDALLEGPSGVLVVRVVENSPADAARLVEGDLLLEATLPSGETRTLAWPADWRALELESAPGDEIRLGLDRAGAHFVASLVLAKRVRSGDPPEIERYREEDRVGLVVRTATEVEARAAGLAPGAGAVVVGLTRESPWRAAGIRFGDLVKAVDGTEVAHPAVVLQRIREAREPIMVTIARGGEELTVEAPLSHRVHELTSVHVPLLFGYSRERGRTDLSLVLGVLRWTKTPAAWTLRLLWVISLGGGDADRLAEVDL